MARISRQLRQLTASIRKTSDDHPSVADHVVVVWRWCGSIGLFRLPTCTCRMSGILRNYRLVKGLNSKDNLSTIETQIPSLSTDEQLPTPYVEGERERLIALYSRLLQSVMVHFHGTTLSYPTFPIQRPITRVDEYISSHDM